MVRIGELGPARPGGLLQLPATALSRIARFLPLDDVCRLAATCRALRVLVDAGGLESLQVTLRKDAPSLLPLFWRPLSADLRLSLRDSGPHDDTCVLVGNNLHQDSLLNGGLPSKFRARFLAQCIGLDDSFFESTAAELAKRSHQSNPRSRIHFRKPYRLRRNEETEATGARRSAYNPHKKCGFAHSVRQSLLARPPKFLTTQKGDETTRTLNGFLTFLVDSSSDEGSDDDENILLSPTPFLSPLETAELADSPKYLSPARKSLATSSPTSETSGKDDDQKLLERFFPSLTLQRLREICIRESDSGLETFSSSPRDLRSVETHKHDALEWTATLLRSLEEAPHHLDGADELFEYLIDKENVTMTETLEDEIERDIGRTLPTHFLFRACPEMQAALLQVLRAIAIMEPGMGYCQGMNFIAGVLVIETLCPATSFWVLLAMIRQKAFSGLYCPGVPSLRVKLLQYQQLCEQLVPQATAHLTSMGLHTDLIGHQCFVTAFAYFLHPTFLVRLYDVFLVVGWQSFMALALVVLKILEPRLLAARDAEAALRCLQTFRVSSAKATRFTVSGARFFAQIKCLYAHFARRLGPEVLSNLSISHFVKNLRATIRAMDLPIAPAQPRATDAHQRSSSAGPASHEPSSASPPQPSCSGEIADPPDADSPHLLPPFMLVPRFPPHVLRKPRSTSQGDIQCLIVNFVTSRTLKCFKISPTSPPPVRAVSSARTLAVRSRSTEETRPLTQTRPNDSRAPNDSRLPPNDSRAPVADSRAPGADSTVSWCLLASSYRADDAVQKLAVVKGRGSLPLSGFYVLVDSRMHTSERETSRLRARRERSVREPASVNSQPPTEPSDPLDPLRLYLFPHEHRVARVKDLAAFAFRGDVRSLSGMAASLADHSRSLRPSPPPETPQADVARRCQRSATELLKWMRAHNDHVDGGEDRRSVGRGGFVVAPLRAVIQAKLRFDLEDLQLAQDRESFDQKIAAVDRSIDARRRETEKVRGKRAEVAETVAALETEKRCLVDSLHDTVTSPSRAARLAADAEDPPRLWSKVLGGFFSRHDTRKTFDDFDQEATAPVSLSTSPVLSVDSETDETHKNLDETGEDDNQRRKNIVKLHKRLKILERQYAGARQRLSEVDQRIGLIEESLREAQELRATLLTSYYQLAVRQERSELNIVENMLRQSCDWAPEPLPLALLRLAGVMTDPDEDETLFEAVPDLYAELLSLPEFWSQFKALFLAH